MPFTREKNDAIEQYLYLVDCILNKNASLVFGKDGERLKKVIELFADVLGTRFCEEKVEKGIEMVVKLLLGNPATAQVLKEIGEGLSDDRKIKLNSLIN